MLKRYFFSALAALVFVGCMCLINVRYMDSIMQKASGYAEDALDAAQQGDLETACAVAIELYSYWQEKHHYLESVLMHVEVDKTGETLSNFVSAGLTGDMENFIRTNLLLTQELSHLAEIGRPTIHNIL